MTLARDLQHPSADIRYRAKMREDVNGQLCADTSVTCVHRSAAGITCGLAAMTYQAGKWLCVFHAITQVANRKRR